MDRPKILHIEILWVSQILYYNSPHVEGDGDLAPGGFTPVQGLEEL